MLVLHPWIERDLVQREDHDGRVDYESLGNGQRYDMAMRHDRRHEEVAVQGCPQEGPEHATTS